MNGQGNFTYYRPGHISQIPRPPFQAAPHVPPPPPVQQGSIHQLHQPPPPLQYQNQQPFHPLSRPASSMPGPYLPPPPAVHGGMPYFQQVPPYPPPPVIVAPPPPPSQVQMLYRTPPPPPSSMQHIPGPPPLQESSDSVFKGPTPFVPSVPLPSPPPLPSSPPPPAPSPPRVSETNTHNSSEMESIADKIPLNVKSSQLIKNFEAEETFRDLSPPKPEDVDLVKTIEVTCQFVAKLGDKFEEEARMREVNNPRFAFLFGGEPGSDASLGHAYYQWLKRKCQHQPSLYKEQVCYAEGSKFEDDKAVSSQTDSDMDMEDDIGQPEVDGALHRFTKDPNDVTIATADAISFGEELPDSNQDTSSVKSHTGASIVGTGLLVPKNEKDVGDSLLIEDISPGPGSPSHGQSKPVIDVQASTKLSYGGLSLVNDSHMPPTCKIEEGSGVFVKDESPFRLIQGYASDVSDEDGKEGNARYVSSRDDSLTAFAGSAVMPKDNNDLLDDEKKDNKPSQADAIIKSSINTDGGVGKSTQVGDIKGDFLSRDVDEFGRLVRRGASDSDSDGMHNSRKRGRRRKSYSSSESPQENKQRHRSRSPRRRKKRSRSRSWSPRRSRSRTPPESRQYDLHRRERDQHGECFNFKRGRCFRGSTCRFLHRDLRQTRTRQQHQETEQESRRSNARKDVVLSRRSHPEKSSQASEKLDEEFNSALRGEVNVPMKNANGVKAILDSTTDKRHLAAEDESSRLHLSGNELGEATTRQQEAQVLTNMCGAAKADPDKQESFPSPSSQLAEKSRVQSSSEKPHSFPCGGSLIHPSLSNLGSSEPAKGSNSQVGDVSQGNSSLPMSADESLTKNLDTMYPREDHANHIYPNYIATGQPALQSQVPLGPPPSIFSANGLHQQPSQLQASLPQGPSVMHHRPQPYLPASSSNLPHQPHIASQFHSYPVPPLGPAMSSFPSHVTALPTRPARPSEGNPLPLQQNAVPYPPQESSHHPSFPTELSHTHMPITDQQDQPYREERLGPHSVPQAHAPNMSYSREAFTPQDRDSFSSQSQGPFVTQDAPMSFGMLGSSLPRFSSNFSHYNPFASTFERPPGNFELSSGMGSSGWRGTGLPPHTDRPAGQFISGVVGFQAMAQSGMQILHAQIGEQSREASASFKNQSIRDPAAGNAYDPMIDSIEPSSSMSKKFDPAKPDEFGELAMDAEAGVVENVSPRHGYEKNWSPDSPIDMPSTARGEIEVDQVQSPGKSKKKKDSRSIKLFKIALADFVKDVLKPSWRQGNMSKEAFKTIVKKTVDKVSGAMPSHQIPKTQAKINRFVESSQKKLTKLVMGYVDKYVKM